VPTQSRCSHSSSPAVLVVYGQNGDKPKRQQVKRNLTKTELKWRHTYTQSTQCNVVCTDSDQFLNVVLVIQGVTVWNLIAPSF